MRVEGRWLILILCAGVLGCAPSGVATHVGPAEKTSATGVTAEDYWEAVYLQSSQVGYVHTQREQVEEDGRSLWRTESETRIELLRFGESTTQWSRIESWEDDEGRLVRFATESSHGATPVRTTGTVADGELLITTTIDGQESTSRTQWPANGGGFDAVNKTLLRDPLEPNERRTATSLVPGLDQPTPATVELTAGDWESMTLDGEPRKLLRVDAGHRLAGGASMNVVAWVNERGQVMKTEPAPGMFTLRTTKEVARRRPEAAAADIGRDQLVRLSAPAGDLHRALRAKYLVRLEDGSPAQVFPRQPSQLVEAADDSRAAYLTVTALRPSDAEAADSAPEKAYRASSPLVRSDDPRVQAMAAAAIQGAPTEAARAAALERFVHEYIEEVSFSQAFATATEVIESRRGDCTEHAVLLASLARAADIPSRVAVGLVYTQSSGDAGFAFHMWNELYVNNRWIAYDATLGLGGIGAGHMKLSDSHLAEGSALSSFLPVMQVMGQLSIEVLEIDSP